MNGKIDALDSNVEEDQVLCLFENWTADLIAEERLFYPDQNTLNDFLTSNFPQYVNDAPKLWAQYSL